MTNPGIPGNPGNTPPPFPVSDEAALTAFGRSAHREVQRLDAPEAALEQATGYNDCVAEYYRLASQNADDHEQLADIAGLRQRPGEPNRQRTVTSWWLETRQNSPSGRPADTVCRFTVGVWGDTMTDEAEQPVLLETFPLRMDRGNVHPNDHPLRFTGPLAGRVAYKHDVITTPKTSGDFTVSSFQAVSERATNQLATEARATVLQGNLGAFLQAWAAEGETPIDSGEPMRAMTRIGLDGSKHLELMRFLLGHWPINTAGQPRDDQAPARAMALLDDIFKPDGAITKSMRALLALDQTKLQGWLQQVHATNRYHWLMQRMAGIQQHITQETNDSIINNFGNRFMHELEAEEQKAHNLQHLIADLRGMANINNCWPTGG